MAPLPSHALISLRGPDWRNFLQGLITQDVETLQPGELRYGALLTPQGRMLNDLFIAAEADGAILDVAAAARAALIDKLTLYRLRAKVEIAACDEPVWACWGDAPPVRSPIWLADPRLPALGWRAYSKPATYPNPVDEAAYDTHRLALGVADPAKDGAESDYPIELNLDLLNGIDFKKGCFVGQETTSRMHRRGQVKTRAAPVRIEGIVPFGAEILSGERRAGEVRGGGEGWAIAIVRIDRVFSGPLTAAGYGVSLELPSWLARSFQQEPGEDGPGDAPQS